MEILVIGALIFFSILGFAIFYFIVELTIEVAAIYYILKAIPIILGTVAVVFIINAIIKAVKNSKIKKSNLYWENKKEQINNCSIDEFLQLNAEILKKQDYELLEIKQHLWFVLMVMAKGNNKYLFFAPNIDSEMDFERFAEGMDYIKQEKRGYARTYMIYQDCNSSVYEKLLQKCCIPLNIVIRNEQSLIKTINSNLITKLQVNNSIHQNRKIPSKETGYKKIFPNVMIDDNDENVDDFDKALDDMMFMDLMDED